MAEPTVNGSGDRLRPGARTLLLLAAPLNLAILRALKSGGTRQAQLRRDVGLPAQSSLRAQLKRLIEFGAIEPRRCDGFPGALEYELTAGGRDLSFVIGALERWLEGPPSGSLSPGGNPAKATIKALADGWSTGMLRTLAAGPRSLIELDGAIGSVSYPSLQRRLGAMAAAGLVEQAKAAGRGTPYAVTDWLRRGVAPLTAACRWEGFHLAGLSPPAGPLEVETGFLLAAPQLSLPARLAGRCRLAAETGNGTRDMAGVTMTLGGGGVVSCSTQLAGAADGWALGSFPAWLDAVLERDLDGLRLGGRRDLDEAVIDALHGNLCEQPAAAAPRPALDV